MSKKGLLIVISGPSGAGKGTICKELFAKKLKDLELSVSATTRKPRPIECEGISYFFKETQEFEKMIENNEFIEYAKVYDNYYGTPKKYVIDKLQQGKDVVLEIDVQGGIHVKNSMEDAVLVFIMPPSLNELKNRINTRGTETKQDIAKRIHNAYTEVCLAKKYDYLVLNDDVEAAAENIKCIISAEKCRLNRCEIDFECFKEE